MVDFLDGWKERVEIRLRIGVEQSVKLLPMRCDKLADRGNDVLGFERCEAWQR